MEEIIAEVPAPPMQENQPIQYVAEQTEHVELAEQADQAAHVQENSMQVEEQNNAEIAAENQVQDTNSIANFVALPIVRRRRGQTTAPPTVELVRRSNRLAELKGGFKDKPPTGLTIVEHGESSGKNLTAEFEAHIVDTTAPAPPLLPTSVLQAIGGAHCQMASAMVTGEELNYDSTNDSIESN